MCLFLSILFFFFTFPWILDSWGGGVFFGDPISTFEFYRDSPGVLHKAICNLGVAILHISWEPSVSEIYAPPPLCLSLSLSLPLSPTVLVATATCPRSQVFRRVNSDHWQAERPRANGGAGPVWAPLRPLIYSPVHSNKVGNAWWKLFARNGFW